MIPTPSRDFRTLGCPRNEFFRPECRYCTAVSALNETLPPSAIYQNISIHLQYIVHTVLTIAGSDSGGGAGIQADLKTFEAHGVFGTSAITSVTAQNTLGVRGVWDMPPEAVRGQIEAVLDDFTVAAIKIGMLSSASIIAAVADVLEERGRDIPIVLDPVMVATSGDRLLRDDALRALTDRLMPLATLLTPNVAEADVLCGFRPDDRAAMERAALHLFGFGPKNVLVKGGDRVERDAAGKRLAVDILFDGQAYTTFVGEFVESRNTHGTGCTLSSAIAANLACGLNVKVAVERAKQYVSAGIRNAPGLGNGNGPLLHRLAI